MKKIQVTLTKKGKETATYNSARFEFHHFHLTFGDCKALEHDITLVQAFERGELSAWCVTGLTARDGFSRTMKSSIRKMAEDLKADRYNESYTREFILPDGQNFTVLYD